MNTTITLVDIRAELRKVDFADVTEFDLHDGLGHVLHGMGLPVNREVRLSAAERIDVTTVLPHPGRDLTVGFEVKVKGPAGPVRRQLLRYAQLAALDALVLVTTLYGHAQELGRAAQACHPDDNPAGARLLLAGKPFDIILTSRGIA